MIIKSYAKLNIFLKIIKARGDFHEILSRFVKLDNLFDEIYIEEKKESKKGFQINGDFSCSLENNTIFKAFKALSKVGFGDKLNEYFSNFYVYVKKQIPQGGGFGGGSSNAASFMNFCNKRLKLGLSLQELIEISSSIGSDIAFFICDYKSANVSGVGEIVEEFDDDLCEFELKFPNVFCSTPVVYKSFRDNFWSIDQNLAMKMSKLSTKKLLETYEPSTLNDLYLPALKEYECLKKYIDKTWFMSGSGSGMFRKKNG